MIAFEVPGEPVAARINPRTGRKLKATDDELRQAYLELGSVKAAGARFGMGGQSAHERLARLGVVKGTNEFTAVETKRLQREYALAASIGKLQTLADAMGRTKPFLCRQAKKLGLTDKGRSRPWLNVWKDISDEMASAAFEAFKASPLGLLQYCAKAGIDDGGFSRTMRAKFADEWDNVIELKQPKQGWYRLGRAVEYRVRDHLKACGFFAQRSPGSKTPIDVTGIAPGVVLFIQCKRSGSLGVAEWNALFDLARSCGARPVLAASATGRGLQFYELLDRKDGSRKRQPMTAAIIANGKLTWTAS